MTIADKIVILILGGSLRKYNAYGVKLTVFGIILIFLIFFISSSDVYSYFTATAKPQGATMTTATIRVGFTSDTAATIDSNSISDETRIVPGQTLKISGNIQNIGNSDIYMVLQYRLFTKKASDETETEIINKYYTFDESNNIEEITDLTSPTDTIKEAKLLQSEPETLLGELVGFNFSYDFDFHEYDNSYQNGTARYLLTAYAIQTTNLPEDEGGPAVSATKLLIDEDFFESNNNRINYISGNSVQYGKNLLDFSAMSLINTTETAVRGGWEFEFGEKTDVTISYGDVEELPNFTFIAKVVTNGVYGSNQQLIKNVKTISLEANQKLLVFVGTDTVDKAYNMLSENGVTWIQVEKGTAKTSYVPFGPSPTNPVEIQSVGDKSRNLFNLNAITTDGFNINENEVEITIGKNNSSKSSDLKLKQICPALEVGKTYTISYSANVSKANISLGNYEASNFWQANTIKTLTQEDLDANVRFGGGTVSSSSSRTITFSNIQVEEGDVPTAYEPYAYKVTINPNIVRKNLLPNDWTDFTKWKTYGGATSGYVSYLVKVKPNTTYTISKQIDYSPLSSDNTINLIINASKITTSVYTQGKNEWLVLPGGSALHNGRRYKTVTTDEDGVILLTSISLSKTGIENLIKLCGNLQIEEGTIATDYEPYVEPKYIYLDEPLRKVGDYSDYIDFKNGKVVRNVVEKKLSDITTWQMLSASNGCNRFEASIADKLFTGEYSLNILCDHFKTSAYNVNENDSISERDNMNYIRILTDKSSSLDDFLEKFGDAKIYYVLNSSVEESITLPDLTVFDSYYDLIVETEVEPSLVK